MRVAVVLLALSFIALPLAAQSNDIGVWYSTSSLDSTDVSDDTGTSSIDFDDATGYGVSINHFWSNSLSTEVAAHRLESDGSIAIDGTTALDIGKLKLTAITAAVQWHFMKGGRFSPYVGAGIAHVSADDLSSNDLDLAGIGEVAIDTDTTWMADAGLNVNFGSRFAVGVDAKYVPYSPDSAPVGAPDDSVELDFNPLVVSAGVRLRF